MSMFLEPRSSLKWVELPECEGVVESNDQDLLESALSTGGLEQIYTMGGGRRSVYRYRLSDGREIAIKEVFHLGLLRQFKLRYLREPKILREFRSGCTYLSRGGQTPQFLGMAYEKNALFLKRGFIFLEWLSGAVTLTEYLKKRQCEVDRDFWEGLAESLVMAGRRGLVHGGHSPENIMVVLQESEPERRFQIIDFADAEIFDEFNPAGFSNDMARIGARTVVERACERENIAGFVDAIVEKAWEDDKSRSKWKHEILAGINAILSGKKKM